MKFENLKYKEFKVEKDNTFYLENYHINCELAIKNDKKFIILEAQNSHKDKLEELYDKDSLRPESIRVFFYDEHPIYAMLIYVINYKDSYDKYAYGRYACGSYYPFYNNKMLLPHLFQNSICW